MSTITQTILPNGDIYEVRSNPGCAPLIYVNGVIQPLATMDYVREPWTKWFAWRPVRLNDKWTWLRWVYRKPIPKTYATMDDWAQYEYGTILDVLKE